MIMRLVLPRYEKVHFLSGICSLFLRKEDEVHYIGGAEILPPPLEGEREAYCIRMLDGVHAERARKELIEHNLRLVVYIAKKFDNTGVGVEDLISIGTIGLIKGINTFNPDKNIKLATYASRCIENEILMYLRRNSKTKLEVSIDEPLNVDWDGNELLLSDSLLLKKNLEKYHVPVRFEEYKGMWHVFQMSPFKTAYDAMDQIAEFIFDICR